MDIKNAPKQFIENVHGGHTEEFFALSFFSGDTATTFALTPKHAKRFSQWMAYQVESYEKKHGTIDAQWVPGMKSPIQSGDIAGESQSG